MKIGGVDPASLSSEEVLVLPRGDDQIVFRARGLHDMEEFNKLCPEPQPPVRQLKGGRTEVNPDDKGFKGVMAEYSKKRLAFMVVRSLEPSDIEWETVKSDNHKTWTNWETDLKNAGLSQVECNRVLGLVLEANCLDEAKIARAREVFLHGPQRASDALSSPTTEVESSPSGQPATA